MRPSKLQQSVLSLLAGVLLLVAATSPFWTMFMVKQHAQKIVEDSVPGLAQISLANANISDGFVDLSLALANSGRSGREEKLRQIELMTKRTDVLLNAFALSNPGPAERAFLDRLMVSRNSYRATRALIIAQMREGHDELALHLFQETALPQFAVYKQACDDLVEYCAAEASRRGTKIMVLSNYLLIFQGGLLVFFLYYAFLKPMLALLEKWAVRKDFIRDV